MNVGSTAGIVGSAAGAPLSQTKGSETERAGRDAVDQVRHVDGQERSEQAAGIGQTQEDSEANDRDADGRRLWEDTRRKKQQEAADEPHRHLPKDPTGNRGNSLDLQG